MKKLKMLVILALAFAGGYVAREMGKTATGNPFITKAHAQEGGVYYYPQVQNCSYRWNLLQKIYKNLGVWPVDCPDVQLNGIWYTAPRFDVVLSPSQITALNAIFAEPAPCDPPTATGTRYKFIDIYENRGLLGQKWGLTNFWIWYGAGGSEVYIYFDNVLTTGQKNKVNSDFASFFQEF